MNTISAEALKIPTNSKAANNITTSFILKALETKGIRRQAKSRLRWLRRVRRRLWVFCHPADSFRSTRVRPNPWSSFPRGWALGPSDSWRHRKISTGGVSVERWTPTLSFKMKLTASNKFHRVIQSYSIDGSSVSISIHGSIDHTSLNTLWATCYQRLSQQRS